MPLICTSPIMSSRARGSASIAEHLVYLSRGPADLPGHKSMWQPLSRGGRDLGLLEHDAADGGEGGARREGRHLLDTGWAEGAPPYS